MFNPIRNAIVCLAFVAILASACQTGPTATSPNTALAARATITTLVATPISTNIPTPADTPTPSPDQPTTVRPTTSPVSNGVSFTSSGQQFPLLQGGGVALGDLDGDGDLDAFIQNEQPEEGDKVYLNDGKGQFTENGQQLIDPFGSGASPVIADINADGKLEVITGKTVWLNDGQGNLSANTELIEMPEDGDLGRVSLADLDGDGDLDLFAIRNYAALRVYLNDGEGHFSDSGQRLGDGTIGSGQLAKIVLGDINGDNTVDAITAGWRWDGSVPCPNHIWLNDGQGNFTDSEQLLDEGDLHVHGMALGDIDQDGDLDLIIDRQTASIKVKVFLNDGKGIFTYEGQTFGKYSAESMALGDFNGDGSLDLFLGSGGDRSPTPSEVWLNDGHGQFINSQLQLGQDWSTAVALGDLNDDGMLDAFVISFYLKDWGNIQPSPAQVWLNTMQPAEK